MNYQVYQPSSELSEFIKCFWTLEAEAPLGEPERQRVLPDGCTELIFHYGDHYKQYFADGSFIIQPKAFVFGQISSYLEIAPTGVTGIIAARFVPGGLEPFISLPVSEMQDKAVPLEKLFGETAGAWEKAVLEASDTAMRIQLIEEFLLHRLSDPKVIDQITKSCVQTILDTRGQVAVAVMAQDLNTNRRHIERKFMAQVGMSPKQLARAIRLQSAIKLLGQKQFTSLTSLAYETGYYDQAHFIHDFKDFTGISPKSFFAAHLTFAALFAAAE